MIFMKSPRISMWLLCGYCVATVWLLCGCCVATVWLLCGYCVATVWLLCCILWIRMKPMSMTEKAHACPHAQARNATADGMGTRA